VAELRRRFDELQIPDGLERLGFDGRNQRINRSNSVARVPETPYSPKQKIHFKYSEVLPPLQEGESRSAAPWIRSNPEEADCH